MDDTVEGVQETINVIQNDSTLMFIGGIALAVLLAIVLVVVVSSLRVKSYKDRFKNLLFENKEKSEHIVSIEKELQSYKIKDAKNQQELSQFDETKQTLKSKNESQLLLQNAFNENEKELSQVKAKLEATIGMYETLKKEHEALKERFDVTLEENTKYRTTNARLLMKLENEERFAQTMKEKQSK
jgi:DNA recombination protein RmuC